MSHKRRSTNAERKAEAQSKRKARKQEDRHEECFWLEAELHREWRERDTDGPMNGSASLAPTGAESSVDHSQEAVRNIGAALAVRVRHSTL